MGWVVCGPSCLRFSVSLPSCLCPLADGVMCVCLSLSHTHTHSVSTGPNLCPSMCSYPTGFPTGMDAPGDVRWGLAGGQGALHAAGPERGPYRAAGPRKVSGPFDWGRAWQQVDAASFVLSTRGAWGGRWRGSCTHWVYACCRSRSPCAGRCAVPSFTVCAAPAAAQ